MALPEYIPQYILTTENYGPKDIVTAEHWNEIFNLLISQGNANAHTIADLIARLTSQLGAVEIGASIDSVPDKNVQAILTALEAALTTLVTFANDGVKFLRLNVDNVIETSEDGIVWQASGSSGHAIYNSAGQLMTQRNRLKFLNCTLSDDGAYTIISGLQGPQGTQGVQGPKGDTGEQGPRGFDGSGSGLYPQLVIYAPVGSVMTATRGQVLITETVVTSPLYIDITDYGTWIVGGTYAGKDFSPYYVDVNVVQQYPLTFSLSVTYTVRIDETNSNPETALTYQDDAVGMTKGSSAWDSEPIFDSIKPCVFQNGAVNYYLNPNNYNQKADGTASDLTGADGDVMVEFPKFAYRIYREGNYLYVSVSNNSSVIQADPRFKYLAFSRVTEGDMPYMYIGAYHGTVVSSKLRSISGELPTVNQTIGTFRTQAQANGTGYQQFTFYQLTALQCLYIIKYGNLNSQQTLGIGWTNKSAKTQTGGANTKGMYYGDQTGNQIKFAGIEDFWGNVYDWIDGLYTNASRNILTGFNGYNDTGSGYVNNGEGSFGDVSGYIIKTQGINSNTGFIIKTGGGSGTTYYSDNGTLRQSRLALCGGQWGDASYGGAFNLSLTYGESSLATTTGARLSYC